MEFPTKFIFVQANVLEMFHKRSDVGDFQVICALIRFRNICFKAQMLTFNELECSRC